ncbi:MAG: AAA family ATPase [Alphaproteobacteria bacterium]
MLKKAKNIQSYGKVGIFGMAASGKSRTATEIAIGLHKKIGSKKPIAVFDTEPAFSWLLPIFEKNDVEILIEDSSRALQDLMTFMDEAEKVSDIAIIDSITHVWKDAQDSFLNRINKSRKQYNRKPIQSLEFHHWRPIKAAWGEFTDRFMSSKMHVIVCGRAGTIYQYQDKDDGSGKKELISVGSRMATEKELGYEPSLLIEMVADRSDGKTVNVAVVQKDRSDNINGKELPMPKYKDFEPHFNALNLGGEHFSSMESRDSQEMFKDADENGFDMELRNRSIYSEEIAELLKKYFPSQSVDDKKARANALEEVFDTRSWTAVENMRSEVLREKLNDLKVKFNEIDEGGDVPQ